MSMATGRVYWITGLSNSGKTTIGTTLYYTLKANGTNVVILDGDLMKLIASGSKTVEYGKDDRITRARRYAQMAKMLADQGQWVIVCVTPLSQLFPQLTLCGSLFWQRGFLRCDNAQ